MSEPLFVVDAPVAPQPAPRRVTEREMLDLLAQRYTRISMNAHRYAFAEHVADRTSWAGRIADFVAVDCYQGNEIHGHEVKVSRSDWLAELRDPEKAEAWRPYVHRWWLVVAHPSIVRDGELPDGWGLMVKQGTRLVAATRAPKLTPEAMPLPMIAALLRAPAKTARRSGEWEPVTR